MFLYVLHYVSEMASCVSVIFISVFGSAIHEGICYPVHQPPSPIAWVYRYSPHGAEKCGRCFCQSIFSIAPQFSISVYFETPHSMSVIFVQP